MLMLKPSQVGSRVGLHLKLSGPLEADGLYDDDVAVTLAWVVDEFRGGYGVSNPDRASVER